MVKEATCRQVVKPANRLGLPEQRSGEPLG